MRHARWTAITAAMVLATAAAASADPITIISDGRFASVGRAFGAGTEPASIAKAGDTLVATVTTPAGTNPGSATATLTSSFADPMHWSGTGTASVSWTLPADLGADSAFITDFLVTSPVRYAFNARLAASSSDQFTSSTAQAFADLGFFSGRLDEDLEEVLDPVFDVRTREVGATDSDATNRSLAGLLSPGKYLLFVDARSTGIAVPPSRATHGAAASSFAFAFDFTPADPSPSPTPEPASLLLLGTAIAGVFGYRRRFAQPKWRSPFRAALPQG